MKRFLLIFVLIFAFGCNHQSVNSNISSGVAPASAKKMTRLTPTITTSPQENAATPFSVRQFPKKVSQFLSELKELQKKGFEMQPLRDKTDSQSAEKCGKLMKKYQAAALDLGEKSETLPSPYSSYLGLASIRLEACVACGSDAQRNCEKVDEDLLDMNNRINSEIKK